MNISKKHIIIATVILIVGGSIGSGITYKLMKSDIIPNNEITTTGDTTKIKIKKVVVSKDKVITKIESKGKGQITGIIPKEKICGKSKKHIFTFDPNLYYSNRQIGLNYNVGYKHIFLDRVLFGPNIGVSHNLFTNKVEGFNVGLSVGIMF